METETAETYRHPDVGQRRWCPDCRRRTTIEDMFEDSTWDARGEVALIVTALDCGHALHRDGRVMMGYRGGVMGTPLEATSTDPWA